MRPQWDYMTRQPSLSGEMRAILVDWLVEVAEEYRLSSETLYLTVDYVDRYLSLVEVVKSELQVKKKKKKSTNCLLLWPKI